MELETSGTEGDQEGNDPLPVHVSSVAGNTQNAMVAQTDWEGKMVVSNPL